MRDKTGFHSHSHLPEDTSMHCNKSMFLSKVQGHIYYSLICVALSADCL